jgi:wyosine [tRNA(Phe)-imidazoG37] synthetase (radical SAM superfamily)
VAYLSAPTRPPAESWVDTPSVEAINRTYQLLCEQVEHIELLIRYEGNTFAATGNIAEDLLSIAAVHPMREDAVQALLSRAGSETSVVEELVTAGHLAVTKHKGDNFYVRKLESVRLRGRTA